MALHKSLDRFRRFTRAAAPLQTDPWRFNYPNCADLNFNYYNLLENARFSSIASNNGMETRIAIIGSGIAGLTAARELFRSGYTNIHIYEASNRIGGRNYSIPVENGYNQETTFEMGAMRMPYFSEVGERNCVLDYYTSEFSVRTEPFPDPGSSTVAVTGIYINDGLGPAPDPNNPPQPSMIMWKGGTNPPNPELEIVYQKWEHFQNMVDAVFQPAYNDPDPSVWSNLWQQVVQKYWQFNFREVAYLPAIGSYQGDGYFGGLGMNEYEANLFYTIGAGDGSWGAFYDISVLYIFRTLLLGFGTNHQLIVGGDYPSGVYPGVNYYDSLGNVIPSPNFKGIQSFSEYMFFSPVTSSLVPAVSLCQAQDMFNVRLFLNTPVNSINRNQAAGTNIITSSIATEGIEYDAVILTPTTWAAQTSIAFNGFSFNESTSNGQLPFKVQNSMKMSHWITSCKVFYPLKARYWGNNSPIPQIITTDTFLQDIYGYAANDSDAGVLLISYTWEDDANKILAPSTDPELIASTCLAFLDEILLNSSNIQTRISPYVDTSQPVVIQWGLQPTYRGCAKLYRQMSWDQDYALLAYNQQYSKNSGLYFAGEAYSVEGGWTEPSLRLALDSVIHLVNNNNGEFLNGFDMSLYPQFDVNFKPVYEPLN